MHNPRGKGSEGVGRGEAPCGKLCRMEGHAKASLREGGQKSCQILSRFAPSFCCQHRARPMAVATQVGKYFDHQFPGIRIQRGNVADVINDDPSTQLVGELHRGLGGSDASFQVGFGCIPTTGGEAERGNPQVIVSQHLPHLPQARAGKAGGRDFAPAIDDHGVYPQLGGRVQGFGKGHAQASQFEGEIHRGLRERGVMHYLLPFLILAAEADASIEGRYPEATEVFHATFDESQDRDYDGWPDGWRRRQGHGYPHFVKIALENVQPPAGVRALVIELDGGGAVALSPNLPAAPWYDFVVEAYVRTQHLVYDRAWVSLTLLDGREQAVVRFESEKVGDASQWRRIRLGPVSPLGEQIRWAVVGLHLEPTSRADLKGSAAFADVWLGRLPRMTLSANSPLGLFDNPDNVLVTCTASGLSPKGNSLSLELLDPFGGRSAGTDRRFVIDEPKKAATRSDVTPSLVGTVEWKPPIPGPGFYRVRASMPAESGRVHRRELTLALIDPRVGGPGGEFGWTLPNGDQPLGLRRLSDLIVHSGATWVKYPLWLNRDTPDRQIEAVVDFCDRLRGKGIEIVGLFDRPPDDVRARLDPSKPLCAADVFSLGPEIWYPSIEHTLTRLGTQVRWWQLGHDRDTSFVGLPGLVGTVGRVKTEMERLGRDVNLGIGWNWMHEPPETAQGKTPWHFLVMTADPPLTDRDLSLYLAATQRPGVRRWAVIEPLPRTVYSLPDRTADLAQRIVAAKAALAEGICIPDPFDPERGLVHSDGTPGEMLLPWRTLALALGGAEPLGSMALPRGSSNQVFSRGRDVVMVVWNHEPVREEAYLGDDVWQSDLWGRRTPAPRAEQGQFVNAGPIPVLVTGLDRAAIQWQIEFTLAKASLPSVFDRRHANMFEARNRFDQEVEGTVELSGPADWTISPRRTRFRLMPGEKLQQPFEIALPVNVSSGSHLIRADFEMHAGRPYRFSAWRRVTVGLDEVRVEISTQLNAAGELEVHQRLINETTQPASFRCQLFAPERRRLSTQIVNLGRGDDLRIYRLSDGKELLGKTLWLQAEEVNGPRVLNYRFVAEQ
jgi:hypothetical protein